MNRIFNQKLTYDRAIEVLDYNPDTGLFFWKLPLSRTTKYGDKAGSIDQQTGYIKIWVDKIKYSAHRVAWLMTYGSWPKDQIDHINNKRDDNRLCNLRESNHTNNGYNQALRVNNTTGFKGVSFYSGKFNAQIKKDGKTYHLG